MKRILALLTALALCLSLAAIAQPMMPPPDLPDDAAAAVSTVPDTQAEPMRRPPEYEGDWT